MELSLQEAKAKLFDLLANDADFTMLCNCLAEFIGNPVALTLPTRTIIARSKDYSSKELLDEYTNTGKLMSDDEYYATQDEFAKNFSTGKAGIFLWPYTRYKHLNCGCLYRNTYVAVLDCPLINSMPEQEQMAIFEAAAPMFVIQMKARGMLDSAELQPMNEFIAALLAGHINLDYQKLYMRETIFDTAKQLQVVWLKLRAGFDEKTFEQRLHSFCATRKAWWCVPYDGGFVILLDSAENSYLPELSNTFSQQFGICVSDEFPHLRDTVSHLELARMALKYSTSDAEQTEYIKVDDYKPLIAYAYAHANSKLNIFTSNILENIREYDSKYNTSYLETLRVCIHYNQDVNRIAERLNLHKNTVFYRQRQLKEIFAIDLKNTRQLANLYLSLCLEFH